ncbi:alginate lyase family protein [Tenacibaculum sp. 190524A05c]|uniref:alginate lyase family protein n=1 Tax=Tenacibaculum platacis TaxID=3137852 RepID=UPI0032B2D472
MSCNVNQSESKDLSGNENDSHPKLILTKKGVEEIRSHLGKLPLFDASLERVKKEVDQEIELGIQVPIPKDYSGGYTHERHKRNFLMLQKAGVLYQILQNDKYGNYVKDMLFAYAKMYPTLPIHPKPRSYARGKLFWQCLNDSNWLVYASQGYDCIYNFLSEEERSVLENDLFKPFADYISIQNPQFFNRVHNHSTWGNAAVGMIALVMNDDALLDRALYGIKNAALASNAKDNDGGFIKNKEGKAGYFANLEEPFSPDGYYTEGPYYQRYAMYPFLIFAEALQNVKPEYEVFKFKNNVLLNSIDALLQLTDADGEFFPINDGQKGMSYYSRELVTAVDVAYAYGGNNSGLLSIAKKQQKVTLDDAGLAVALAIKEGKATPFEKKSVNLSDGSKGDEGGIGILRYGDEALTLVFKYAAQGLSHGHYDKLSFSLFEKGEEVLQDYGLARYVNVEQKGGGNYLKENKTWAKQTVAHNTIVQDETSHFKGKYEVGSKHHSELHFYDVDNSDVQVISATENNAYPGSEMHRTLAVIKDKKFAKPYVLDVFRITSDQPHQIDLPYYYFGQLISMNFDVNTSFSLQPLGNKNGYQHLWLEATGTVATKTSQFTWLNNNKFYTISSNTSKQDELLFARIGANDPNFNLRNDPGLIIRRKNVKQTVFATVIESHGTYSPVSEFSVNATSNIKEVQVVYDSEEYTVVQITNIENEVKTLIISNRDANNQTKHSLKVNNKEFSWVGPFYFK